MTRIFLIVLAVLQVCSLAGCKPAPPPEAKPRLVGWRHIGDWSGRGNTQTESFDIGSQEWRIKWEATGEESPGKGTLLVMVHSAVSGRPIALGLDHKGGNGKGIAYVTEDPRLYHLVVESSGVNWSLTVEEAVAGEAQAAP